MKKILITCLLIISNCTAPVETKVELRKKCRKIYAETIILTELRYSGVAMTEKEVQEYELVKNLLFFSYANCSTREVE